MLIFCSKIFFIIVPLQVSQFSLFAPPYPAHPHSAPLVRPHSVVYYHGSFIHVPGLHPSPSFLLCHSPPSLLATVSKTFNYNYFHISASIRSLNPASFSSVATISYTKTVLVDLKHKGFHTNNLMKHSTLDNYWYTSLYATCMGISKIVSSFTYNALEMNRLK